MISNNKIYKTMIQLSIIFSTIALYYYCSKSGIKKGLGWEAILNQGDSPSFPDTWLDTMTGPLSRRVLC